MTKTFPWLFPDGEGDFFRGWKVKDIRLADHVRHLLRVDLEGICVFEKDPIFKYWALNLI